MITTWSRFKRILISLLVVLTPAVVVRAEDSTQSAGQDFESFSGLRTELLSRIGGASKRIWLSTNFLTDAEIVSSLYIAQYRKVQISVLLGKEKATNILSRLGYLKQVNIPVAIKPKNFYADSPTLVLLDDKLYSITSDLDYLSRAKRFVLREVDRDELSNFEASFQDAAKNQETPDVKPLPLVGGQRIRRPRIQPSATEDTAAIRSNKDLGPVPSEGPAVKSNVASGETAGDGAYRYRRVKDRPAAGVPTKLPKMTLGQELERQRAAAGAKDSPEAAVTP